MSAVAGPRVLSGPLELLELRDGESKDLTVLGSDKGKTTIKVEGAEKTIDVLRLYVSRLEKGPGPPWWDLTSTTLIADVEPKLGRILDEGRLRIRILAFGSGKRKRFTVSDLEGPF